MQQKTFKYRLVPNMAQQDKLAQFAGSVRFVYNHGLALIKQALTSKSKLPFRYPQGFKYREKHVFLPTGYDKKRRQPLVYRRHVHH